MLQGQQELPAPPNPKGGTSIANWDFTTPADGTLDVTISYLYDTSAILVWVTDRPCNKWQFERDECFYLARSLEGSTPAHADGDRRQGGEGTRCSWPTTARTTSRSATRSR